MADLVSDYHALYDMNRSLSQVAQNEEWALFLDNIEPYLLKLQALLYKSTCLSLPPEEKARLRWLLQELIVNTEAILCRAGEQKSTLIARICALRHASNASKCYSVHKLQCTEMEAIRATF